MWKKRRRAITPGFHNLYLERMVSEFGQANANLIPQLLQASQTGTVLDMEERSGSLEAEDLPASPICPRISTWRRGAAR